jgi:hypothetical protein
VEEEIKILELLKLKKSIAEIATETYVHPHLVWDLKYTNKIKPNPI